MNIQKELRNLQNQCRNAGWRIQWIPWQEPGKPEVIHNPAGLIGAVIFVGIIGFFIFGQRLISDITISVNTMIAIALTGLGITFFSILFSSFKKQFYWKPLEAVCVDREIRQGVHYSGKRKSIVWVYRLVCIFNFQGNDYTVTPESSHLVNFNSEQKAQMYLNKRIQPDGRCRLWINPENPLQTIFYKRRWWL